MKLLNENVCSFQNLIDKSKSIKDYESDPSLEVLLRNEKLFEELIQNNIMTKRDSEYLLNTIDKWYELWRLCENIPLIKYVLNEFVLDKEIVDKFNTIIESSDWCKDKEIHTIFDRIEFKNKSNEEILELNELSKYMHNCDLTEDQRLELIDLIQNNEIALIRLIQIVDNYAETNYDFDSLTSYLKKIEKKNLLNI